MPVIQPTSKASTRGAQSLATGPARALIYAFDSPMREVEERVVHLARGNAPVLICGETGSGKEVLARELHEQSVRARGPFVPVSCAAIPAGLLDSAIFGYLRRSPEGTHRVSPGRVALAEGGTLFIDEVSALPLVLQEKLLRLLEQPCYDLPDGTGAALADLRVVLTTSLELSAEVGAGRFREDLFTLISGSSIDVPPLRARRGDIRILFEHLWRLKGQARGVSFEVIEVLQQHGWPGNVRELENLAERLSTSVRGERLEVSDLPAAVRGVELQLEVVSQEILADEERESERRLQDRSARAQAIVPPQLLHSVPPHDELLRDLAPRAEPNARVAALTWGRAASSLPVDLPSLVRQLEETFIEAALDEAGGNKALAARLLGLQRTTLAEKLRRRKK